MTPKAKLFVSFAAIILLAAAAGWIVYPKGGFFWNDGNMATTETMRAEHGDLRLEWPNHYAAAAEVNWTNQA